ncbi:hypothetical protein PYCC9005_004072 [Savitreella phatthalungensis]
MSFNRPEHPPALRSRGRGRGRGRYGGRGGSEMRDIIRASRAEQHTLAGPRPNAFSIVLPSGQQAIHPSGVSTPPFVDRSSQQVATTGVYADHTLDITYTNDAGAVRDWLAGLSTTKAFGFDIEHRPTFDKGQLPNLALIQLAPVPGQAEEKKHPVLIFSVYHANAEVPTELVSILRDPEVHKYGIGVRSDRQKLDFLELEPASAGPSFRDLGPTGQQGISLKKMTTEYMGVECTEYKTKRLTMTNWERRQLDPAELKYAAMDAFCGAMIHRLMKDIAKES